MKTHQKLFTPGIPVFDSKDFWFRAIIYLSISEQRVSENQVPKEPRSAREYQVPKKNVYGLGKCLKTELCRCLSRSGFITIYLGLPVIKTLNDVYKIGLCVVIYSQPQVTHRSVAASNSILDWRYSTHPHPDHYNVCISNVCLRPPYILRLGQIKQWKFKMHIWKF